MKNAKQMNPARPGRQPYLRACPFRSTLPLVAVISAFVIGIVPAGAQTAEDVAEELNALLSRPDQELASRLPNIAGVRRLYQSRDGKPVWWGGGAWSEPAHAAQRVLAAVAADGLDPADYGVDLNGTDAREAATSELGLTASVLRYATDIQQGRRAPKTIDPELFVYPRDVDAASELAKGLDSNDFEGWLRSLAPTSPRYVRLKAALRAYRDMEAQGPWPELPDGPSLKPGMTGPEVRTLSMQLIRLGELPSSEKPAETFESGIEKAVQAFQARHGLENDGVVGSRTRSALNTTPAERAARVALNMERRRWLPEVFQGRHIEVNLAAFQLTAVGTDGSTLSMPVVIGTDRRRTPVFADRVVNVILRPTWTVPPRIARMDVLPKIVADPGYLTQQGMRVFAGWAQDAEELDPKRIDWGQINKASVPFKLRQDPGPNNALGLFRFSLTNTMDIYLHDSPRRELFLKTSRAFSSGCVRVGDALALAEYALSGNGDWPKERLIETTSGTRTVVVKLADPVPVYVMYETVWVEENGAVQFRPDVYGRDRLLAKALNLGPIK